MVRSDASSIMRSALPAAPSLVMVEHDATPIAGVRAAAAHDRCALRWLSLPDPRSIQETEEQQDRLARHRDGRGPRGRQAGRGRVARTPARYSLMAATGSAHDPSCDTDGSQRRGLL